MKAEHRSSDQLRVQLEFRTLKPDSILLYTETTSGPDKGFIQVGVSRHDMVLFEYVF